jgi:hypothetical protein
MKQAAIILAGFAITLTSVVMEAPDNLPYLWALKAAALSTAGIAMLLVNPDAMLSSMRDKVASHFGVELQK